MKKIAIIFNPKAGSGKKTILVRIMQKLSNTNKVELFETKAIGDATNISRKESDNFDIVIAAGGDGTIHEVANGIGHNTLLGIIPMGTANIIAIEAGITNSVNHICKIINEGVSKKVFTPTINNQKFILMVGIGYDAQVVNNINPKLKKIFGKLIFVFEAFKQFFKLKDFNISVKADGQVYNGNWILVTNAKHYAGPFSITNNTNIFNHKLICYIFNNLTKLNFLQSLWFIIFYGDLSRSKHIITLDIDSAEITSSSQMPVQCDGELFDYFPLNIKKNKEYINLIVSKLSL